MTGFSDALHALWEDGPRWSTRRIAERLTDVSYGTVAYTLNGTRLPKRDTAIDIVDVLGGDWDVFDALYTEARQQSE